MQAIVCSTLTLESDTIFQITVGFLASWRVSMETLPSELRQRAGLYLDIHTLKEHAASIYICVT